MMLVALSSSEKLSLLFHLAGMQAKQSNAMLGIMPGTHRKAVRQAKVKLGIFGERITIERWVRAIIAAEQKR